MSSNDSLTESLQTLNQIALTLNREADLRKALSTSLAKLVDLMGLESGWIMLVDPSAQTNQRGNGYTLSAHYNLPPAMALEVKDVWKGGCDCQELCNKGLLKEAYNEVHCSRLASARGDRRGLDVHASSPLRSGERTQGILNVAAAGWSSFSPQALEMLTNIGTQMGIAIERTRLYDLLQEKHTDEQAALLELSIQLLGQTNLEDLMNFIAVELKRLLSADACAIVLSDEKSEWLEFGAASGWNIDPVLAKRLIPADESSGSGWAMIHQQPLLIENIQAKDPTTWTPEWLRAESFYGHAVVPLVVEGRSIGAVMLDNREPRQLGESEVRFLQLMANQAALAINQARLQKEEIKRQRMENELTVGREIQLSLLPVSNPKLDGWEFATHYQPSRQVGGDFYDFFQLPGENDRIGLVVADVTDKGVPAALFMAMCRTMIRSTALSGRNPAQVLERTNELIHKDSQADMFVSVFYAMLEVQTGRFLYANAGHNPPLCVRAANDEYEALSTGGIILGSLDDISLEERTIDLLPNDVIVLYTDGVTEALDSEQQLFGLDRLRVTVSRNQNNSADAILEAILEDLDKFTGNSAFNDDLTLVVLKRLADSSP